MKKKADQEWIDKYFELVKQGNVPFVISELVKEVKKECAQPLYGEKKWHCEVVATMDGKTRFLNELAKDGVPETAIKIDVSNVYYYHTKEL